MASTKPSRWTKVYNTTKIGLRALFRCHSETLCSQLSVNNSLCVKLTRKDFLGF